MEIVLALLPVLLKAIGDAVEEYRQSKIDHAALAARVDQALIDAQSKLAQLKADHDARKAAFQHALDG